MKFTHFTFLFITVLIIDLCLGQEHSQLPEHKPTELKEHKGVDQVQCHPAGVCEPCPGDSLHEPFCQPFGNRRLLHCKPLTGDGMTTPIDHTERETPAWESCGRIPAKERADFWEFVLSNTLFAAGSLGIVYFRSNQLAAMQARTLAARIGIGSVE